MFCPISDMVLRDLQSKKLILTKALSFVVLGSVLGVMIMVEEGALWKRLVLLALCVGSVGRACHFAFYVLEHYVDSSFEYSGLMSALHYPLGKSGGPKHSAGETSDSDQGEARCGPRSSEIPIGFGLDRPLKSLAAWAQGQASGHCAASHHSEAAKTLKLKWSQRMQGAQRNGTQ